MRNIKRFHFISKMIFIALMVAVGVVSSNIISIQPDSNSIMFSNSDYNSGLTIYNQCSQLVVVPINISYSFTVPNCTTCLLEDLSISFYLDNIAVFGQCNYGQSFQIPVIDDIVATLISPSGVVVDFLQNICSTYSTMSINVSSSGNSYATQQYLSQTNSLYNVKPSANFNLLKGQNITGTWVLSIASNFNYKEAHGYNCYTQANYLSVSDTSPPLLTFYTQPTASFDCSAAYPSNIISCTENKITFSLTSTQNTGSLTMLKQTILAMGLYSTPSSWATNNFLCYLTVNGKIINPVPTNLQITYSLKNYFNNLMQYSQTINPSIKSDGSFTFQFYAICPVGDLTITFKATSNLTLSYLTLYITRATNLIVDGSCSQGPSTCQLNYNFNNNNNVCVDHGAFQIPKSDYHNWKTTQPLNYKRDYHWYCSDALQGYQLGEGASFVSGGVHVSGAYANQPWRIQTTIDISSLSYLILSKQLIATTSFVYSLLSFWTNAQVYIKNSYMNISNYTLLGNTGTKQSVSTTSALPIAALDSSQILQFVIFAINSDNNPANFAIDQINFTSSTLANAASVCDSERSIIKTISAAGFIKDSTFGNYNYGDKCQFLINTTLFYPTTSKIAVYLTPSNVFIDPRDRISFSDCRGGRLATVGNSSILLSYTGCISVNFTQLFPKPGTSTGSTYSPGYFLYQYDSLPVPIIQSVSPRGGLGNSIITLAGMDFTSTGGIGTAYDLSVIVTVQGGLSIPCNLTGGGTSPPPLPATNTVLYCFLPLGQTSWGTANITVIKGPTQSNNVVYNFFVPIITSVYPPIIVAGPTLYNFNITASILPSTLQTSISIVSLSSSSQNSTSCTVTNTKLIGSSLTLFLCTITNPIATAGNYTAILIADGVSSNMPSLPVIGNNSFIAIDQPVFLYPPIIPPNGNSRTSLTINASYIPVTTSAITVMVNNVPCSVTSTSFLTPIFMAIRCDAVPQTLINTISVFPSVVNVSIKLYGALPSANVLPFTIVQRIVLTGITPTSGAWGQTLTVYGMYFPISSSSFTIYVGNQICPILPTSYNSTNQSACVVSCTIPPGTGLVQIVAWNYLECSDPAPTNFLFGGLPNMTSISPSIGSTNGNDTITITGFLFGTDPTFLSITIGNYLCTNVNIIQINTALTCQTPAGFGANNTVKLNLINGNINASNTLSFSYYPPSITYFLPASNPLNMPVSITIQGSNLGNPSLVALDVSIGNGTLPSASVWRCKTNGKLLWDVPSASVICAGVPYGATSLTSNPYVNLKIQVIIFYVDPTTAAPSTIWLDAGVFVYSNRSQLNSISPISGASDTGIVISVNGNNFPNYPLCVFLVTVVNTFIQLTSPILLDPLNNVTYFLLPSISSLGLETTDFPFRADFYLTSSSTLNKISSDVTGYLTGVNGYPFTFQYVETITIQSFCPDIAPTNTSISFNIFGMGFNRISSLTCMIGNVFIPAAFLSNTHIECTVTWSLEPNPYFLFVSNDNRTFVSSSTPITFYGVPAAFQILTQPPPISRNDGPLTIQPTLEIDDITGFINKLEPVVVIATFNPPAYSTSGDTVTSIDGVATFSALSFIGLPGISYNITFSGSSTVSGATLNPIASTAIHIPSCSELKANSIQPNNASVNCVCEAGYYAFQSTCLPCPLNTFKDVIGDVTSCMPCQQFSDTRGFTGSNSSSQCICYKDYFETGYGATTAVCESCKGYEGILCPGGYDILTMAGYWRPRNSSFIAYQCPVRQACLGGINSECAKGYTGLECAVCEEGYAHSSQRCKKCLSSGANGFILLILLVIVICFLFYLVRESNKEHVSMVSVALKVILNHLQILSYVGQYNLNWPSSFAVFFSVGDASTINARSFNIQCSLQMSYYGSHLLTLFLPLIAAGFIALYFIGRRIFDKYYKGGTEVSNFAYFDRKMYNNFLRSLLIILYLFHPILFKEALNNLACTTIDNQSVLVVDKSISCQKSDWKVYAGISIVYIIFYSFGGLVLIAYLLMHNKEKFEDNLAPQDREIHSATKRYRFLFAGYRFQCFYWEILVMTRKMIIVTIGTFLTPGYQILCGMILLFEFREISKLKQPYKDKRVQKLEVFSITVLLGTLMGSILFVGTNLLKGPLVLIAILAFLTNIAYAIYALYILYIFKREESEAFKTLTNKIVKKPNNLIERAKSKVNSERTKNTSRDI